MSTAAAEVPVVSLIMTAWKPHREWLIEAVQSALDQREAVIELVVVDDGSPEPVHALLAGVADPRLHVIRIPHGGLSRARNAGMAAARGDYLRFIDCDDVITPDSTARLLRLAAAGDDVIAYGATVMCDERLRPGRIMTSHVEGNAVHPCLLGQFHVRVPALLFPRAVTERTGEWSPVFQNCQDWDFTLRALEHSRVRGEHHAALLYRRHPSTSATGNFASACEGIRNVIRGYFERHPELRGSHLERRALSVAEMFVAERLTNGRPWRSRSFWRAAAAAPSAIGLVVPRLARKRARVIRDALRRQARRVRRRLALPRPAASEADRANAAGAPVRSRREV